MYGTLLAADVELLKKGPTVAQQTTTKLQVSFVSAVPNWDGYLFVLLEQTLKRQNASHAMNVWWFLFRAGGLLL